MSYGEKGDTYNNYGQSERVEHGNETVEAEPEYERRIGAHQAPPGYVFQTTQSYTPAPNAFVQSYPTVLPPVMNSYVNTTPLYPQQPGYPVGNTVQQPVLPVYPMVDTSQAPGIQSSPYPVQPYTEAAETQPETRSRNNPQQALLVFQSLWSQFGSTTHSGMIVFGVFSAITFVLPLIGKTTKSIYLTIIGFVF